MSYRITKEHVWVCSIPDRADGLAEKLRTLSEGGVDLELIVTRRDLPGTGLMFVSPLRTVEEIEMAEKVGLSRSDSFMAVRIAGPNAQGVGAKITTAVAHAGISIRGLTAAAIGDKSVTSIAFDSNQDADKAKAALEAALLH